MSVTKCYQLAFVMQQITTTFTSWNNDDLLFLRIFAFLESGQTELEIHGGEQPHICGLWLISAVLSFHFCMFQIMDMSHPLNFLYMEAVFVSFFFNVYVSRFMIYVVLHSDLI